MVFHNTRDIIDFFGSTLGRADIVEADTPSSYSTSFDKSAMRISACSFKSLLRINILSIFRQLIDIWNHLLISTELTF